MISDESASRCPNYTTVKESAAYLIGKMDGEKHAIPTADVAPRAEVAREIFEEIRSILNKHYYACYQNEDGDECDAVTRYLSYVAVDFDRLEQKYTAADTEPPEGV
jgi:hypothetical protein